jgi:flavin-dependent dehydrogenase
MKEEFKVSLPQLFFGVVSWGYGWVFPRKKHFVVGMAALPRKNTRVKETYLRFLHLATRLNEKEDLIFRSHWLPYGNFLENPGKSKVLLVGDAAGMVDPSTGEGMYYAHMSAQLAYRAILDFFESGETTDLVASFKHYLEPVYRDLEISLRFRNIAYGWLNKFGCFLMKSPRINDRLLAVIHGRNNYSLYGDRL